MARFDVRLDDRELRHLLVRFERQVPYALSRSLNDVAFGLRDRTYEEMRGQFDRPTPYALRSLRVRKSSKRDLTAVVGLREDGPGKGTPYRQALAHQFTGGPRRFKRMEGAFRRIGLLPPGYIMVPAAGAPRNAYGNVPAAFVTRLLSYFHAFGEQGYKANMGSRARRRVERQGRLKKAEGGYRTIRGRVYFVSRGPGMWTDRHGRQRLQHLPMGIWAKTGVHGAVVEPVFLFVKAGRYRQRIDLKTLAEQALRYQLKRAFRKRFRQAVETAKR